LLEGRNFAAISTVMADGSPSSSAVWVDTDGEHVIFYTDENGTKAKNLRRDARVAVSVFNTAQPYQQAMIRGKVVSMDRDGAEAFSDRLAKKYLGTETNPYRRPGVVRIIVKIKPERVRLMDAPDHSKK